MSQLIAIFERQGQAVEAIEALRQAGFGAEQVRVVAKNEDMAWRIDNETDIPVDRLEDEARERYSERDRLAVESDGSMPMPMPTIPLAASPIYLGDTVSTGMPGLGANVAGEGYAGMPYLVNPDESPALLRDLGLSESDSKKFGEWIDQGRLLVVVESGPETEDIAERALRRHGASHIVH